MITPQALEIVLDMAKELRETCKVQREDIEMEAIEEVEFLISTYDDMNEGYSEEDFC